MGACLEKDKAMKKKNYLSSLLLIVAIAMNSCSSSDNPVNPNPQNPQTQEDETIDVSGSVYIEGNLLQGDNYTINTVVEKTELNDGKFTAKTLDNNLPQVIWVSDKNENILMLARFTSGNSIKIDEESTALALVSMCPYFSNVDKDSYENLISAIKSSSHYPEFVINIKSIIANNGDIFNPENKGILDSIEEIVNDMAKATSSGTRSSQPVYGVNGSIEPVKVAADGNNLILSVKSMYPTYECTITHNGSSTTEMVYSSSTYGWLEYLRIISGNLSQMYGPETKIVLQNEGEYNIVLDDITDKAREDFGRRFVNDVFSALGLDNSIIGSKYVNAYNDIAGLLIDPSSYQSIKSFLNNAMMKLLQNIAGEINPLLKKSLLLYNSFKGTAGYIQRTYAYLNSSHSMNFCVCLQNNKITSCTDATIQIISGDGQKGKANEKLAIPLVVKQRVWLEDGTEVESSPYLAVKFEVVNGGGQVTEEIVKPNEETQTAATEWILGTKGEQKVKAVIVNMITNEELWIPLYFTATLEGEKPSQDEKAVDLGLSVLWATCNLGADKPTEYGNYYSWGDPTPKSTFGETEKESERIAKLKDYLIWDPSGMITNFSGTEYDAAYVALGNPWRMPTLEDFQELRSKCTIETNIEIDGIKGNRYTGPNGNSIFFPYGGVYQEDPTNNYIIGLLGRNQEGRYWTSSYGGEGYGMSPRFLDIYYEGNDIGANQGWEGYNIRPVRSK